MQQARQTGSPGSNQEQQSPPVSLRVCASVLCMCLAIAVPAILRIFILTADFWWKNFCKLLLAAGKVARKKGRKINRPKRTETKNPNRNWNWSWNCAAYLGAQLKFYLKNCHTANYMHNVCSCVCMCVFVLGQHPWTIRGHASPCTSIKSTSYF